MLKNNVPKMFSVSIFVAISLVLCVGLVYEQRVKKQGKKKVALTKAKTEALQRQQPKVTTSHIEDTHDKSTSIDNNVSDSFQTDTETSSDTTGIDMMSSDSPVNEYAENRHAENDHKEVERAEREAKRQELSQRVIELAKESRAVTDLYLATVDEELSLMNPFLANISETERYIAHQALVNMYPSDADDLDDFFHEISNSEKLTPSQISDRAKQLITSREARDIVKQQHDARWAQLRSELYEFYGDELTIALEQIKLEN